MKSSKGKAGYRAIRALTIRQPFPELIFRRRKPYEIRSWRTNYRGPLVIHSAAKVKTDCAKESRLKPETLMTSAFVGIAVLSDVRPFTRADSKLLNQKRAIGGWSPGQFSWVLKKPLRFARPIKANGKLGLFTVPPSVARLVRPYLRKLKIRTTDSDSQSIARNRSEAARRANAKRSPAERSRAARKAWATRRRDSDKRRAR
jgi:activating signal cointegrator 1